MAKIDGVKEEIGRLKLHFGLLAASYLSLLVWIMQDTAAYVGFVDRLIEAICWSSRLRLYFAIAPILLLTALVIAVDVTIRRKIQELEDC